MFQDISVFVIAVVFVAINGLTMLAWAAAQGYKMKPTAFAFLVGAVGNLLTGSITPISGQSSILTVSHFMKNVNERIAALLIAVIVMVPLGLTGAVTAIADFAGPAVVSGMMAGVGLIVAGISIDMFKQAKRTGAISFIGALATHVICLQFPPGSHLFTHRLVYVIAVSVTLATIDFVFFQTDPETGKRGRRVDIFKMAKASGYEGDMEQNENPKFWTKEYWADFKIMKPKFGFYAIYFALAFISLNIGTNIAFGNITAGMGGTTQNMNHLTVINSLADIPSVLFGGAPVGAIISATAAAPWPSTATPTNGATPSNAASTRSKNGEGWPPATTKHPTATSPDSTYADPSSGYAACQPSHDPNYEQALVVPLPGSIGVACFLLDRQS